MSAPKEPRDVDAEVPPEKINEEKKTEKINLDKLLVEEIGEFGKYQAKIVFISVCFVIFCAFASGEYIFTTGRIATRCLVPECEDDILDFSPSWILNAVPGSGDSFDGCSRYIPINTTLDLECPADKFDLSVTQTCENQVYENTDTVVYDFDLGCNEWLRSSIGSFRIFGTLLALPITGFVSDYWGRRVALALNAFNTAWMGTIRYFANTYWGFVVSQVLEAVIGSGGFSCAYIIIMELVGPKYRVAGGTAVTTFFSVGQIIMGLIAWALPNWRLLTLALYIPQLITLSFFWIINESVRWLMSKGRYDEANAILKNAARVNGKELSDKSLEALRINAEEETKKKELDELNGVKEPWLFMQVIRCRPVLLRCLACPIMWVTMTLTYYGLSINSVNLSGNRYVNYISVAAVDIPAYWLAVFLMMTIGRKPVMTAAYWICASCMIGYIFLPTDMYGLSLTLYLIGKFSIAIVTTAIYIYTAEIFPTKNRHSLFAFCSMIGRIGNITAPLTPALAETVWSELPFVLFASFCVVSGTLMLFMPETLNTRLPDTMQEAAELGDKK